jgi:hypothetical protein
LCPSPPGFFMKIDPSSLEARYISRSRRENPNIEMPPESIPVPPDEEHGPPIETPPKTPDNQPDPPLIEEPNSDEPKRLF